MTPKILLSFDVEEFDMPLEYNFNIAIEIQMEIGKKGLDNLMPILLPQILQIIILIASKHYLRSMRLPPILFIILSSQQWIYSHPESD